MTGDDESPFDAFAAAGLFDADASNATERREYLGYLLERGFTVEQICSTDVFRGPITDLLAVLANPPLEFVTISEIAEQTGLSLDDLAELRSALGLPTVSGAADIATTFAHDAALFQVAAEAYGRPRALAFVRVLGSAIADLMEAALEMAWAPMRDAQLTELELAQGNEAAMMAWRLLPETLGNLMLERAARDVGFEQELREGAITRGIAFVDLVDSTSWTFTLGGEAHAEALNRFESMAVEEASRHSARVIKFIGDEAMLVSSNPDGLLRAVVALCARTNADARLPNARGAVGWGPVSARGGDYFGEVVNVVARLTKEASVDAAVVTEPLVAGLTEHWAIGAGREVELRGVASRVAVFDVAIP